MTSTPFRIDKHEVPCQHIRGYPHSTANSQEEVLQLAIKQYTPLDNQSPRPGDVTIIACHATGLLKELYEPFFEELYRLSLVPENGFRIRSIWIADAATHGQSSVLNEGRLGIDYCWDDHARDLLQMVNVFRAQMPRPIIGFGHSMGGAQLVELALLHPRLITSVILLEPILLETHVMRGAPTYFISYRQDVWPSRELAVKKSKKSGMQRTWDPRVLERWQEYGFRDLPTLLHPETPASLAKGSAIYDHETPVTLTTTKHHDARAYARGVYPEPGEALSSFTPSQRTHPDITKKEFDASQQPVYNPAGVTTYRQLPFLRPSCLCLYSENATFVSALPKNRAKTLSIIGTAPGGSGGQEAGNVREAVVAGGGHFVVLEKPAAVAEAMTPWLRDALRRFQEEQAANEREWQHRSIGDKAKLDDAWMFWVKEAYGRPKPAERKGGSSKL